MKKMQEKNKIDSTYFDVLKADEMKVVKVANEVFRIEISFVEEELNLFLETYVKKNKNCKSRILTISSMF